MQNTPSSPIEFQVLTFTVRYHPIEDRMILNVVDRQGAKQSILMTRRLMDQLIPVFVQHLEEKTPQGVPADIVQSMSQEQVRQDRQESAPSVPVEVDEQTPQWLCKTIHLQKQPAGIAATLTDDHQFNVQLPLLDVDLRTVLDIFRNSYVQANWGLSAFPEWSEPPSELTRPDRPKLLN
jgi:hypothetical protein